MLAALTPRQLREWQAFYQLHHLGDYPTYRGDIQAGTIAAAIINVNTPKGKKGVTVEEAMPTFEEDAPGQHPLQVRDNLLALNRRRPQRRRKETEPNGDAPQPVVRRTRHEVRQPRPRHRSLQGQTD